MGTIMDFGAEFSECKRYRYRLWREWYGGEGTIYFIGLNPSTANHTYDDPTVRRLIHFSKSWGYKRFEIVNLFAWISSDPKELLLVDDPIGKYNDEVIFQTIGDEIPVFMWGSFQEAKERGKKISLSFPTSRCFVQNKDGSPRHPLYLPNSSTLQDFNLTNL